jgi:hypothetical protein
VEIRFKTVTYGEVACDRSQSWVVDPPAHVSYSRRPLLRETSHRIAANRPTRPGRDSRPGSGTPRTDTFQPSSDPGDRPSGPSCGLVNSGLPDPIEGRDERSRPMKRGVGLHTLAHLSPSSSCPASSLERLAHFRLAHPTHRGSGRPSGAAERAERKSGSRSFPRDRLDHGTRTGRAGMPSNTWVRNPGEPRSHPPRSNAGSRSTARRRRNAA